jgi:hypothetical protein
LTAVRWFGGVQRSTATAKGQNFGVDQISYGRGEIKVTGTVATTGAGFKEIADVVYDSARTNRWGVITVRGGVFYVRGKIIIGHASSNTTFSSQGETVVWETPSYYNGTNVVKAIPDASSGGTAGADGKTTYNGLAFIGGSGTTAIDFGVIVGSDAGRSGSSLVCAQNAGLTTPGRTLATVTVDSSTMALSLYATTFAGFEGQIDLTGTGVSGDDCYGCTFNGCGRIDSNMEIRNVNVLNSVVGTTDGAFIWSSTTDLQKGVFANNSRAIVFESATGSPFTFTSLTFSGNTKDVRNESGGAITINIVSGTTPTTEDSGGGSATTLVINPVDTTITVKDIDGGAAVSGARVLVTASDNTGTMPFEKTTTISRVSSTATAACTGHGLVDGKKALIKGADQQEYNGVFAITFISANSFSYTVSGSPTTPATGSIKTTGVVIDGTTNGSGVITDTRSHASNQPITGRVRKATSGTLYKTGVVSGTIDNSTGFSTTVQLIADQ